MFYVNKLFHFNLPTSCGSVQWGSSNFKFQLRGNSLRVEVWRPNISVCYALRTFCYHCNIRRPRAPSVNLLKQWIKKFVEINSFLLYQLKKLCVDSVLANRRCCLWKYSGVLEISKSTAHVIIKKNAFLFLQNTVDTSFKGK